MTQEDYYGVALLPSDVFNKLKSEFFISHSTDDVKYMCANDKETTHLISLGAYIDDDLACDWYKLVKAT